MIDNAPDTVRSTPTQPAVYYISIDLDSCDAARFLVTFKNYTLVGAWAAVRAAVKIGTVTYTALGADEELASENLMRFVRERYHAARLITS